MTLELQFLQETNWCDEYRDICVGRPGPIGSFRNLTHARSYRTPAASCPAGAQALETAKPGLPVHDDAAVSSLVFSGSAYIWVVARPMALKLERTARQTRGQTRRST